MSSSAQLDASTAKGRVQVKISDEKYLRSHPELRWLVDKFVEAALLEQPTDVESFAREFFTKPTHKQEYLDSGPVGTGV